ncbi:hypothetical protein BH11MYX4_BH11MYX4_67120 [soil metagenome]
MSAALHVLPSLRKIVVGLAGVLGGLVLVFGMHGGGTSELAIPLVELVSAAVVVHLPALGPQLFARAVWWSNLGLGAIICVLSSPDSSNNGPAFLFVALCAFALLAVGRGGLGEAGERGGYAPAAFRSSLLLLMVLALADAQTFFLFLVLVWRDKEQLATWLVLGPAVAAYVVGFVGLYRLRPWGAFLNALASLVVLVVTLAHVTEMDHALRHIVEVLTAVHVLAAAPMLLSLATGRPLPAVGPRVRAALGVGVVLAVVLVSGVYALGRDHEGVRSSVE